MDTIDEFGKDPAIQKTRILFSMMEKADKALQESLGISPFDKRLRMIRDIRHHLYEKSFSLAMNKGLYLNKETALAIFEHCQKIAVVKCGFNYPQEFTENPKIAALVQEAMS